MSALTIIEPSVLEMAEAAAKNAWPNEACGLLLSIMDAGVDSLVLCDNVTDGDPGKSFEIDPILLIRCQKAERMGGPKIMGVWHSHPDGAPSPSQTDKTQSEHAGWLWLITAVNKDKVEHGLHQAGREPSDIHTIMSYSHKHGALSFLATRYPPK